MVDAAVIAYYNMIRTQGWIGNLALVIERELFGQPSVSDVHGADTGERVRQDLERLREHLLPLLDRAHKMMVRSLSLLS